MTSLDRTHLHVDPNTRISPRRLKIIKEFSEHTASFLNLNYVEIVFFSGRDMPGLFGACVDQGFVEIAVTHDFRNMLSTIAHELCHAFQFQSGRLINAVDNSERVWLGKRFKKNLGMTAPWEQEALQFERDYKDVINFFASKLK